MTLKKRGAFLIKKVVNLELTGGFLDEFNQVKSVYSQKEHFGKMSDEEFLKMLIEIEHFKLFKK